VGASNLLETEGLFDGDAGDTTEPSTMVTNAAVDEGTTFAVRCESDGGPTTVAAVPLPELGTWNLPCLVDGTTTPHTALDVVGGIFWAANSDEELHWSYAFGLRLTLPTTSMDLICPTRKMVSPFTWM